MALPTGPAVTFLFSDIEGSTRLERAVGSAAWANLVARHDALLRSAIEDNGGVVVKTEGDAFFAAFDQPADAAAAAVAAQRALAETAWPEAATPSVRMGLHLGEGRLRHGRAQGEPEDYVGIDVNYAARIAAAGNGGQILLSERVVVAIAGTIPAGTTLLDEGMRIVKDFEAPTRLYRLLVPEAADDPRPLRTLEAPSNLPVELTPLIGREQQIEKLAVALEERRVVTLTGQGGSGKTRLAIGVAHAVRGRFPHGVWFVDLAAIRDPTLLEQTIATTIGIHESAERTATDTLRAHLRERELLLVLDNLEQLLPDAARRVADLARAAPRVRTLVTSRELLRIAGESGHVVPPLDLAAAVALFEDRARLHRPDLQLTDEARAAIQSICERLEGLPLAIELAAARIRLFSPVALLDRLGQSLDLSGGARDLPDRQRTLRTAIDWSHELLTEPEQRLFRRLAVFVGGWNADLAQGVVEGDGETDLDLFVGLESLMDKSLVRAESSEEEDDAEPRFSQHALLREYALEQLEASGERRAVEARHAAACVEIADLAGHQILSAAGRGALKRLDREQHNLRAAIDWSIRADEVRSGLRISASIWRWFQQRGRLREGRAILGQLLDRPSSAEDARLRIAALAADGGLAYWMEDFQGCRVRYEERLELATQLGDTRLLADAHYDMAFVHAVEKDPAGVHRQADAALELYAELGDEAGLTRTRQSLVLVDFLAGDYARARDAEERALAEFRAQGSTFEVADGLTLLGAIYEELGDPATAWSRITEGLSTFAEANMASGIARSLGMAALVQLKFGDAAFGARITGAIRELRRQKSVMLAPAMVLHLVDPIVLATERLGAARVTELLAEGAETPLADVITAVLASPAPARA